MTQTNEFPRKLKRQVVALQNSLKALLQDPEQEIVGIAVAAFDGVIEAARLQFPEDPVISRISGPYEHEFDFRSPVRAADALLVVDQIDAVIGLAPPAVA
jgi:hypothetical protein